MVKLAIGKVEAGIVSFLSIEDGMQRFEIPCKFVPVEYLNMAGQIFNMELHPDHDHANTINQQISMIQATIMESKRAIERFKAEVKSADFFIAKRIYEDSFVLELLDYGNMAKEAYLKVYGVQVHVNGALYPCTSNDRLIQVKGLSQFTDYKVKLIVKTSDGPIESSEVNLTTKTNHQRDYRAFIACEGFHNQHITPCDRLEDGELLIIDNVNNEAAEHARSLFIRTVTRDYFADQ